MTPFGDESQFYKFLRNAGFYLTFRNLPMAGAEPVSRYLHCFLDSGEMEFPVDLT